MHAIKYISLKSVSFISNIHKFKAGVSKDKERCTVQCNVSFVHIFVCCMIYLQQVNMNVTEC